MQSSTHHSERSSIQRQRCGGCSAFCPRTHADHINRQFGICAHTNGDLKMPGTVHRDQAKCVMSPSKFKPKESRS